MAAAVELAGPDLGAVRIDSGDLPVLARHVRALLDELGATRTRIVLTGDLDEYSIAALAATPVDGYGVGTALVTGSGRRRPPWCTSWSRARTGRRDVPLRPMAKRSVGKPGRGGRKWAVRHRDEAGVARAEEILLSPPDPGPGDRLLLTPLVRDGVIRGPGSRWTRRATGTARCSRSFRRRRSSCPAATPPSLLCSRRALLNLP